MSDGIRVSLAPAVVLLGAVMGCAGDSAKPAPPPSDPVVAPWRGGAYAAAVPGLVGGPALSGGSVSFAVEDESRERLFSVAQASADGSWRRLYTPPARRPGSASWLLASSARVVLLRDQPDRVQSCFGGECTPSAAELIAGPPGGPLRRAFGATERLEQSRSCRRRIAQLGDAGGAEEASLSGDRIAYARRVRCLSPRRRGHWQVVVRNLRTGEVRVIDRGAPAVDVQLAGPYLALRRYAGKDEGTTFVVDLRSRRIAYRVANAG
jgi:hypothetical protein